MTAPKTSTWLITGASSGIGKSIALAAFQAGHKVVATSRNITSAKASFPEFSNKGGIWVELDPGNEDAFEGFSKCAEEHDIDVLVNNAGYAFIGGVEDTRSVGTFSALFAKGYLGTNSLYLASKKFATKWKSISTDHCAPSRLVSQ